MTAVDIHPSSETIAATWPRPLHDYVLLRPAKRPTMSKGGLELPDVVQDEPQEGTILIVGPGRVTDHGITIAAPFGVMPGRRAVFAKFAGFAIEVEGEPNPLRLLRVDDILAVYP